ALPQKPSLRTAPSTESSLTPLLHLGLETALTFLWQDKEK
ncbi:hypothetical protein ACUXIW_005044, partial [Ralstonia pickettii]